MPALRATGMTALVAALAAGCGGNDAPELGDPGAALDRAPRATAEAESAHVALAATMAVEGVDDRLEFGGQGALDLKEELGRLELDLSEMATFRTEGGGTDPDLWRGTVLYTGDVTLMKLPAFNSLTPEPDKWIRWNDEALVREGGAQFAAPDPLELLGFVGAVGRDVSVEGEDEVRGEATTHLRAEVAVGGLAQAAAADGSVEAQAYAQRLQTAGLESFPLDVWLDAEGRIRRLEARYDDLRVSGSQTADLVTSVELYDFGSARDVRLPPANEIVDIGDVIGRGPDETEHSEE
jgi:hypothetical protein